MADSMMQEAVTSAAHALRKETTGDYGEQGVDTRVGQAGVDTILASWPETPQKVAHRVIEQYGAPNEAIASRLIWYQNGPWKRTIIYRDEVPHNFPKPHTDLLEQFIDYHVPIEAFDDLAAFDGSVIAERTKGEMSARCDMEAMNVLALNLAHEIVTGARSVEQARDFYAETATAFMSGDPSPYTERLLFDVVDGGTVDFDEVKAGPMINQMMEQAREMVDGDRG